MPVLQGNTSGSVATVPFNIPSNVISGYLTNRTGGTITVNLYVATGTGDRAIIPLNLVLVSGTMYILEETVLLKEGYYFIIAASGSLDYYFSIK